VSGTVDRVIARIDSMRDEIAGQASSLVRIESVNPKYPGTVYDDVVGGESDASRFMAQLYRDAGASVDLFSTAPGRENAVGVIEGSGGGRSLILNGHVDVVPVGLNRDWADGSPFSGRVDDDRIWGRGTTDQKCGVVAQAMAITALKREGIRLRGDLIIESVVGEEVMDHEAGVSATIDHGYRADAAIVSEPTGPPDTLSVVPVSPGLLWFAVTVRGKASHASVRDEMIRAGGGGDAIAVNAIEKALVVIETLQRLESEWGISKRHPLFKPGHFTIHPGVIQGGPFGVLVPFIISQYCTIEYACWFHPEEDVDSVKGEIATEIDRACAVDPWLRSNPPTIEWKLHWPSFSTKLEEPVIGVVEQAHQVVTGDAPRVGGSRVAGFCAVCDATFLTQAGIPTVVYGPGSVLQAHTVDEWVDKEDVVTAVKTYAVAALDWCGEG
jgi:acetylornithine deacetylase